MNQCPKCGKFLKAVKCEYQPLNDNHISDVWGRCYSHGKVHPVDWFWEQFFPEPKESEIK